MTATPAGQAWCRSATSRYFSPPPPIPRTRRSLTRPASLRMPASSTPGAGTDITFTISSGRRSTTSTRDGMLTRKRRHLSFKGPGAADGTSVPYTGVWNPREDLVTGELGIPGGQFRVELPGGWNLVGADARAAGNRFERSGGWPLTELRSALVGR